MMMCTCTPTLLVVVLNGLAHGVVDNKPDIWFVNAHAKRHRGNHNLNANTDISAKCSVMTPTIEWVIGPLKYIKQIS